MRSKMDVQELLTELERRGVQMLVDGERLRYRPKGAVSDGLRAAIAEHQHALVARLTEDGAEVRWRADAMRAQLPPTGPIPVLAARPITAWAPGGCSSCGDPLGPEERYRCGPCIRAALRVLRELRAASRGAWGDDR
jgi:hypothetical protein